MALTSKDLYPPAAAFRTLVTKSGDVESSSSSSFEAKVFEGSDPNDGSPFLEVTYSATGAGAYDVAVDGCEWNFTASACDGPFRAVVVRPNDFVPAVAQPFRVTIRPGPSDAAASSATLRSTSAVVGGVVEIELRAFDANGNPARYDDRFPGDEWSVAATRRPGDEGETSGGGEPFTIRAVVAPAVNSATGSSLDIYVASFATTRAGTYDVVASLLTRSVNDTAGGTKGTSFRSVRFENGASAVTVAPGALDVSKSRVDAAVVSVGGAVGDVVTFAVYPTDAHGNPVSAANAAAIVCAATAVNVDDGSVVAAPTVGASALPPDAAATRCYKPETNEPSGQGRLVVEYRVVVAGTYAVSVVLDGERIQRDIASPRARFRHAEPAASRCFMSDQGTLGTVSVAGGDGVWFDVTARDAFDNVATDSNDLVFDVHALPADGSVATPGIPGTSRPLGGGRYRLKFSVPRGGAYSIDVKLGDAVVGDGDFPLRGLTFADPPVDVARSYASGAGLSVAVAGEPSSFTVQLRDAAGEPARLGAGERLFARVDLPAGSTGLRAPDSLSRVEASDRVGAWIVRYTAYGVQDEGERYSIIVGVESGGAVREISGSPFAMTVVAGEVSAANTFARPNAVIGAYRSSADVWGTFDVVARDAHNNSVDLATDGGYRSWNWTVEIDGATRSYVRGGGAGVVSPVFKVTAAGTYSVTVRHDGAAIGPGGSPVTYTVVPGALDYAAAVVAGDGIDSNVTVGAVVTHSFTLAEADSFGNVMTSPTGASASKIAKGLIMTVRSARWPRSPSYATSSVDPTVAFDSTNKVYVVSFRTTVSGALTTRLEIGGFTVRGSPFETTVLPGPPEPSRCVASGPGLSGAVAGEWQIIEVDARDAFDNRIDTGELGLFRMFVKRSDGGFSWTPAGDASPNYADTPVDPDVQVEPFRWDVGRAAYVGRYKSTTWTGSGYDLDVAVVSLASGASAATARDIGAGRRTIGVKGSPGAVDAAASSAFGPGLSGGVAGSTLAFTVTLADSDGVKVPQTDAAAVTRLAACRKTSSDDDCEPVAVPAEWGFSCAVVDVESLDAGSLSCTHAPTTSGVYRFRLSIASLGTLGFGGEGTFLIRSGASDGDETALRVGTDVEAPFDGGVVNIPDAYVAGMAVTFTVVPRDAFGNPQDYSLAPFDSFRAEATIAPAEFAIGGEFAAVEVDPPSAKDKSAGFVPAYSRVVAFTPTVSGAYEVDLIFSNSGSTGEAKISVTFSVEASALDARGAVVSGDGVNRGRVFRPQTFSVLMHDAYGNPVAAERPGVAITAVFTSADDPADSFTAAVAWNTKLGRYNAEYSAENPGLYYANLTLDAGDGRGPNALALPSSYVGTVIEAESVDTQKCEVSAQASGRIRSVPGRPRFSRFAPATSTGSGSRGAAPCSTRWRAAATARPQRERRCASTRSRTRATERTRLHTRRSRRATTRSRFAAPARSSRSRAPRST